MNLFFTAVMLTASLSLFGETKPFTFCNPAAGWERMDCVPTPSECRYSCGNRPSCYQQEEACPAELAPSNVGCYCLVDKDAPIDPF